MVGCGRRDRMSRWYGNGTKAMKETNSLTCFCRINYPVRFATMAKKSASRPVRHSLGRGGFSSLRALFAIVLCSAAACLVVSGTLLAFFRSEAPLETSQRTLTFAERVAYQKAIEEVYWRHRIWPRDRGERPDPKPPLDAVMSQAQLEKKVEDYLRNSQAR